MHQNSLANLQKWEKGVSGNPTGRRVGSKNIATLVNELLAEEISPDFPLSADLQTLLAGQPKSYAQAVVYSLFYKAISGDVKAMTLLVKLQARGDVLETTLLPTDLF